MQDIQPTPQNEPCNANQSGYISPALWNQYFSQVPLGAEGRLPQQLRQIVQQGGEQLLQQAVFQSYALNLLSQGKSIPAPPSLVSTGLIPNIGQDIVRIPGAKYLFNPFSGLLASGGKSYAWFQANATEQISIFTNFLQTVAQISSSEAQPIIQQTIDDINAAASVLYAPVVNVANRKALGWIPVSAEDDPPTRPINVPTMPYPQADLTITVNNIQVRTRYMVASTLPIETAHIPSTGEVMVFIHGHMSKIEEASDFAPQLLAAANAVNRPLTLVMFDQPSCGYSSMVDHSLLDPGVLGSPDGQAPGQPGSLFNVAVTKAVHSLSAVKFIEAHITAFVNALDNKYSIANRMTAFVGGSLGGHMGVRFACAGGAWPLSVVAWSPASMWSRDSLGPITITQAILDGSLSNLVTETTSFTDPVRANYFSTVFDQPTFAANSSLVFGLAVLTGGFSLLAGTGNVPPQPLMWYRAPDSNSPHAVPPQTDDWPCKAAYIANSRIERQEIYNRLFRDWHWRVAAEMCYFNFLDEHPVDGGQPYYNRISRPLLLMAGVDDNYQYVQIHDCCGNFAQSSTSRFLQANGVKTTGHSIHNERPAFLASQVLAFAPKSAAVQPPSKPVKVPDIVGMTTAEGMSLVDSVGLDLSIARQTTDHNWGIFLSQAPPAGTTVMTGTSIEGTISAPPKGGSSPE